MQLFHPTHDRLIIREKSPLYYLLFGVIFLLFAGPVGLSLARSVGATVIRCQRQGSRVDCTRIKTGYWGAIALETTPFPQVTQVSAVHETHNSGDGAYRYDVHWVSVTTGGAVVEFIAPPAMVGGVRGDPAAMAAIANAINAYLQSPDSSFKLKLPHGNGWGWLNGVMAAWVLLFLIGVLRMVVGCFSPRLITLNYHAGELVVDVKAPFHRKQYQFAQARFLYVYVVEQVTRSHKGGRRIRYVPQLSATDPSTQGGPSPFLNPEGPPLTLASHCHLFEAERLVLLMRQFLALANANHGTWLPPPKAEGFTLSQIILEGDRHHYRTANLPHLPSVESDRFQATDQELRSLGFQWLGDLWFGNLTPMAIYGYVHPSSHTYAVMIKPFPKVLRAVDFYSTFIDGASLTTTNHWLMVTHLPQRKIYRHGYPKADLFALYQEHRQHQQGMVRRHGRPQAVGTSLRALALAIDQYLVRQS